VSGGRVIAFDLGERRIGYAVSDPTGFIADRSDVILRSGASFPWRAILAVIEAEEVTRIVVGDPLRMDGTVGERSRLAREFAAEVAQRSGLPVELEDERLTSVEAESILRETGRTPRRRAKGDVDRKAAELILQAWLDEHGTRNEGGAAGSDPLEERE
jgi:putative Holliday junction resolvase